MLTYSAIITTLNIEYIVLFLIDVYKRTLFFSFIFFDLKKTPTDSKCPSVKKVTTPPHSSEIIGEMAAGRGG